MFGAGMPQLRGPLCIPKWGFCVAPWVGGCRRRRAALPARDGLRFVSHYLVLCGGVW